MENLIDKFSQYDTFNFLLSGVVFEIFFSYMTKINLHTTEWYTNICIWYFIGLVISRIGSLILEFICKKTNFVKYSTSEEKLKAEKKDENKKLPILLQNSNMYRTLTTTFIILTITSIFHIQTTKWLILLFVGLIVLFLFSYQKASNYYKELVDYFNSN